MTKNKRVPFEFKNEAKNGRHIVTLSGTIRKRYWSDDDCIDAKMIRDSLDDVTNDITIKLNSPGGDVFQGMEIYNYLKDHPSQITVEVTGEAASAATFIIAGADNVIMNTGTTLMIHEASTFTWGNKADVQKTLNALETIDESIISIYVEKTGQSAERIETWMKEEKWFTADQAVEFGFADEVKKAKSDEPNPVTDDLATLVNKAVAAAFAAQNQLVVNPVIEEPKNLSLLTKLRKGAN